MISAHSTSVGGHKPQGQGSEGSSSRLVGSVCAQEQTRELGSGVNCATEDACGISLVFWSFSH